MTILPLTISFLAGSKKKEGGKELGRWNPAKGKCKEINREYILWPKYHIPIGQILGKHRSSSRKTKIYCKLLQIYTGWTDSILHQQLCAWQFIWRHHPPAAWRAVKTNRAVYMTEAVLPGWQARKICISSLFRLSLRAPSQGVGSSRGKAVDHTLWSWRCQHRVLFLREREKKKSY